MVNFKQMYEANEESKGAFKRFPIEQQPQRIPISEFPNAVEVVKDTFGHLGQMYFPDSTKKAFDKTTTGDIDVVFLPHDRLTWIDDILKNKNIITSKKNGPQLMTVMKFPNGSQYMVDFLLTKPDTYEFRKSYVGYGTLIPAIVGSFARSLGYKFAQDGLYARVKDLKGNYHNIKLTTNPNTAYRILGLDTRKLKTEELYTPEGVVQWVINSPRFDSHLWNKPHQTDGQTIVTKNRKSHAAAKKKPEVVVAYKMIDAAKKVATWDNNNYKIERQILGDDFMDSVLNDINKTMAKSQEVLNGKEIMEYLNILGGPKVGEIIKYLRDKGITDKQQAYAELDKYFK